VSVVFQGPLVTDRLILRRLERGDVAALCAYRSIESVARYQLWESFGLDAAARLVEGQLTQQPGVPGTWFQLAIVDRTSGVMAGDCGLHCREDDPRQMEIGVTFAPDAQGRGLAAEAVGCVLDYIFGVLGKHRVVAITDAENHRAAALFRRLGFRQEAHFVDNLWFKGKWGSEFVFGLLKREWESRA
jgi:RimJ/RimL family protein N-acetyltransferase